MAGTRFLNTRTCPRTRGLHAARLSSVSRFVSCSFRAQSTTKDYFLAEKQASIYILYILLDIHSTSHCTTSPFFSNYYSLSFIKKSTQHASYFIKTHQSLSEWQNCIHNFGTQTQENKNKCFGACLHSAGTQHWNLHQVSVARSRVTYFIERAHTETGVSLS